MFREANSLLMEVGVIMMALALALLIAAAVVSVTLRSEPERVVTAEVATKSPGEAQGYSSGEEGSATKNSSSGKDSHLTPLGSRRSRGGTARPPLVSRWSSARRKLGSRRHYSSRRKPNPRTLSPQCLNRRASKHLLRCPLSRSPDHNSTNPTNKSKFCRGMNKGSGQSPPNES